MAVARTPDSLVSPQPGGGIAVELAELEPLAHQLFAVAGRYEEVGAQLGVLAAQVALLAPLDVTGAGSRALTSLGAGALTLSALVAGMQGLARGVESATENYRQAEAFAHRVIDQADQAHTLSVALVRGVQSAFGYRVDQFKLLLSHGVVQAVTYTKDAFLLARTTPDGRKVMQDATGRLTKLTQMTGTTGRLRATRDMTEVISPSLRVDNLHPGKSIPRLEPNSYGQEVPLSARGIAEHFQRMEGIENRGDELFEAGHYQGAWDHVMVQTLYNPETGETQYLVTIPGTDGDGEREDFLQPWRGGTNTWAGTAGSATSGYRADLTPEQYTALMAQVERALEQAGAAEGSGVILAGFSQGGLTAGALAANTHFGSRYRVKGLITQGSPVDEIKVPASVTHVDTRYRGDPVPYLQGDRPDYAPDVSLVMQHRPEDASVHGSADYVKIAGANPGTEQVIPELQGLMGGYSVVKTTITAGSTQKPDITRTEQEQMALAGVGNTAHAAAKKIGLGNRFIDSASINPADLYQDADSALRTFDTEVIQKGDIWLDTQLRKVEIGSVQLYNPTITLPAVGEQPPAPMPDSGIRVYEPTAQQQVRNLTNLAGVGDLISDEAIDEGVRVFLPSSSTPPG
ncbi:MAG: hypothetical protein Q4A03_05030 [Rothia sp. (in: high G+C Gram-positive bacteria)]|uniref:hypothetical protein n=1 Tax=Rothia sp. (in: high G+C Gram-positive bacteria) TaxID=1885016 RepID=UPI00270A417C|nr:hypothetical protein [Rothia sp. (in: high G+C Gram-positive bacteria)]